MQEVKGLQEHEALQEDKALLEHVALQEMRVVHFLLNNSADPNMANDRNGLSPMSIRM